MKVKGLRKKISVVVIVPLIIGLILTRIAAFLPLYIYYPKILNNYSDKMIDHQSETVLQISMLLANSTSLSYIQKILNELNVGSDMFTNYLFYGLDVKNSVNTTKFTESSLMFNEKCFQSNECANNQNISIWYLQNLTNQDQFSVTTQANFHTSSLMNTIFKPVSELGSYIGETYKSSYLTYNSDGFFYAHPAEVNFFGNGQGCPSNCSYCNTEIPDYYEPRCRPFYAETIAKKSSKSFLTSPYQFYNSTLRGQSACRGQWNYTTSSLILVYCIDFALGSIFEQQLLGVSNNNGIYTYLLTSTGVVLEYRNLAPNETGRLNITQLEFGNSTSDRTLDQISSFEANILTLFTNQRTQIAHYKKGDNKEMIIAVSPVMMIEGSDMVPEHVASVGVVLEKSRLESIFNHLEDDCYELLLIEIYISIGLFMIILGLSVWWTDQITRTIISPMDDLLLILKRMRDGDLGIDILAAYKTSPPEIACLYEVFDKLRVVLRFAKINPSDLTQAILVYSQALNLFISFGNKKAMEICYREIARICYQRGLWEESAEYFSCALQLVKERSECEELELAKYKTETANALIKSNGKSEEALRLFGEASEVFKKNQNDNELAECLLDIAEAFYEAGETSQDLLLYIEKFISNQRFINNNITSQRYLYIRGLYYKNLKRYQDSSKYFVSILEDFSEFSPVIRVKVIKNLQEIFNGNLGIHLSFDDISELETIPSKDIILVLSSKLVMTSLAWIIPEFIKFILEPNDRLSLLQFHSVSQLIFNLTVLPMRMFKLENHECDEISRLYDCMLQGVKQLSLNSIVLRSEEVRKEWMIVLTDRADNGSDAEFEELEKIVIESNIGLIVLSVGYKDERIMRLAESTQGGAAFYIKYDEQAPIVFKEIEAYICPYREVYLVE